jgi:uncharacterized coiled-coil DUF342 family protein
MSKSKAISSDVNNLFSKIEKQALEYEEAFNELNKFFRNADRTRRAIEELVEKCNGLYIKNLELYEKFNAVEQYINLRLEGMLEEVRKILDTVIVKDFNIRAEEVFKNFELRAEAALGLIEGKEGFITLVENVRSFAKEADSKLVELDNRIDEVKNKGVEMDSSKNKYDNMMIDLENKSMGIENKIAGHFKEIQDKYNLMFNDLSFNLENRIKNAVVEVKETQISINQKVRTTDEKLNNFMVLSNELFKHIKELKEKSQSNIINKSRLDALQDKIDNIYHELNNKIIELKNIVNKGK